jgi:protein phosphatase 1D
MQEACRLLDKYGVLNSANAGHESSEAKRVKRWEQNDYYSSDEDEYLDRTKTIQVRLFKLF